MIDSKPWWASKTVWGGIIAVVSAVAGAFGYIMSPEAQTEVASNIANIGAMVGGLIAVYGRVKATHQIK